MATADDIEDVRLAIYREFSTSGQAAGPARLAELTGLSSADVSDAMQALHEHRDIVLGDDRRIVMAHPFASVPLGFSVMGAKTLWWGGCAWDSFAIPHLVRGDPAVLVATTCPGCGAPHAFVVNNSQPPQGTQVAHFLTPTSRIWDDVVNSCAHQRIFCGEHCVTGWLAASGNERGYVMDLPTLWRLASSWYAGRLDRGYRRREPTQAAAYFAEVGLSGPFWGLP